MREGEMLTMGGGEGRGRDYLLLIINICAVKNVTTARGGSSKNCYGGKPKNVPPPCGKGDPPHKKKWPPHGENVYTFCTHGKNAPRGEKKPPIQFFFMPPPLPGGASTLPPTCVCRS